MAFTQVTIVGYYQNPDGSDASGSVTFTPTATMRNTVTPSEISTSKPVTARLTSGAFTASLAAVDDTGTTPEGVTYRVEERITGMSRAAPFFIDVPFDAGTIDLNTWPRSTSVSPAMAAYLTQAEADLLYAPLAEGGGSAASPGRAAALALQLGS